MNSIAVSFFIVGFLLVLTSAANQKIGVTVYYETLCPDSIKFINKQLYPTYNTELGQYMNVTLVPFGKAKYHKEEDVLVFECRHGETECEGDKIQSCVIKNVADAAAVMKFVDCSMASAVKGSPYPTDKCLKEANISNTDDIKNCTTSTKGSELLAEYGAMTTKLSPALSSVPRVDINDKFNSSEQSALTEDFKTAFCAHIQGTKPEECSKKNGAASFVASLLPIVTVLILTRISN